MSNKDLISFTRLDSIPSHIEEFGKKFADHFKVKRDYVREFCQLIQTSKRWKMENLHTKLNNWVTIFSRIPGTRKITELVIDSFNSCENNDEIKNLRGVMVEALIIGCHGGSSILTKRNYGWGARVDINLQSQTLSVYYECINPKTVNCKNRSTVDFGYWNSYHGKFYECKAQPDGIGCKEVSYMEKLKESLKENNISHEIFFVCPAPRDEVKIRLEEDLGLSPIFHPIGVEDIIEMLPA